MRINALDTGLTVDDLAAVVKPGLDAVLIPKVNGATDLERIAHYLDALEAKAGMASGSVKLAILATETPKAMFALGSYAPAHPRLIALTWGAEDLAAALGAADNKEADGSWTSPYEFARTACLFAASAAEVMALDTVYTDFRDAEGFERDCRRSRHDGFVGRLAIHPDQVAAINRAYAPSEAEVAHARKIVAAFDANPGAGASAWTARWWTFRILRRREKFLRRYDRKFRVVTWGRPAYCARLSLREQPNCSCFVLRFGLAITLRRAGLRRARFALPKPRFRPI